MKKCSTYLLCLTLFFFNQSVIADQTKDFKPTVIKFDSKLIDSGYLILGIYANEELGCFGDMSNRQSNGGSFTCHRLYRI